MVSPILGLLSTIEYDVSKRTRIEALVNFMLLISLIIDFGNVNLTKSMLYEFITNHFVANNYGLNTFTLINELMSNSNEGYKK
jgi:hypothetical protein